MKNLILILAVLSTASIGIAAEQRGGSMVLSLGGLASTNTEELDDEADIDTAFGAAALIEANVNDVFGIETGVLFTRRAYEVGNDSLRLVQEVNRLHVPVAARFWVADFFSIAAGPYVSFRTGDVDNALEIGDEEVASLETSAEEDVTFGADVAATLNFAVDDKTGIFVEGRYSTQFDQLADETSDVVTGIAGLKLDFAL